MYIICIVRILLISCRGKFLKKIILINKFYRDFCFSNRLIACFWFDVSSFSSIEDKLNGKIDITNEECDTMEDLMLNFYIENEKNSLEYVIRKLLSDLDICASNLKKFKDLHT